MQSRASPRSFNGFHPSRHNLSRSFDLTKILNLIIVLTSNSHDIHIFFTCPVVDTIHDSHTDGECFVTELSDFDGFQSPSQHSLGKEKLNMK